MNDSFGTVLNFKQRLTSHLVSQKNFPPTFNSGPTAVIVQWLVLFVVAEATQVRILVTAYFLLIFSENYIFTDLFTTSSLFCTLSMTFQFLPKVTYIPTPMLVFEGCPLFRFAAFYLQYFQLFRSEFCHWSREQQNSSSIPIKILLTNALP